LISAKDRSVLSLFQIYPHRDPPESIGSWHNQTTKPSSLRLFKSSSSPPSNIVQIASQRRGAFLAPRPHVWKRPLLAAYFFYQVEIGPFLAFFSYCYAIPCAPLTLRGAVRVLTIVLVSRPSLLHPGWAFVSFLRLSFFIAGLLLRNLGLFFCRPPWLVPFP